jgi:hypothetical protein
MEEKFLNKIDEKISMLQYLKKLDPTKDKEELKEALDQFKESLIELEEFM